MDENLFESVQYSAWVFLFIFALSFGIYQYSRMNAVIDQFVSVNMFNDRGTGTGVYLESGEVKRKASRAEVIMSIMNLADTVNQNGNSEYYIDLRDGGNQVWFESFASASTGINTITATGDYFSGMRHYAVQGVSATSTIYYTAADLVNHIIYSYLLPNDEKTEFDVEYIIDVSGQQCIIYTRKDG